MPEGDTIHRAANRLRSALEGATLVRFEAPRLAGSMPRPGTTITAVEARGKYLLVRFADGWELQTHLRMTGRWDLYRTGERWRKPAHLARAIIEVDGWVAICFSAPTVRMVRVRPADRDTGDGPSNGDGMRSHRDQRFAGLTHLGPDLCRADVDLDLALRRMGTIASPDDDIADVLLDQRVAAGVGNVFKSEVLWACRLHPLTPLGQVDGALRRRLLETAAAQLQANLTTSRRTTVAGPPGSLAVYGRGRRPCRRCGTPIRWQRTGRDHRSTYWCPRCQPAPDHPG